MAAYNDDTDNYGASADLGAENGKKTLGSVKAGGAASKDLKTRFQEAIQDAANPVLDHLDKQVRMTYPNTPTDPAWEERMKAAGRRGKEPPSPYVQPNMTGGRG